MDNILVIGSKFIGDTVLLVPFLRQLRAAWPLARIEVLIGAGSAALLVGCPYVDQIWEWPKKTGGWAMARRLRPEGFSRVYVLKRSWSAALLAWAAGIPERVGFATQGRDWLLTKPMPYPTNGHEAQAFLSVLAAEGQEIAEEEPRLELWLTTAERDWAAQQLAGFEAGAVHVGVHAVSTNAVKDWPLARWSQLIHLLQMRREERDPDRLVYIHGLGGPGEAAAMETIRAGLPQELRSRLVNHCGQGTVRESAALIERLTVLVGVDSGPLHLAAAVGTATVAIFGPSSPQRWRPLGECGRVVTVAEAGLVLPCQPCQLRVPCHLQRACLRLLPVELVVAACEQVLARVVEAGAG